MSDVFEYITTFTDQTLAKHRLACLKRAGFNVRLVKHEKSAATVQTTTYELFSTDAKDDVLCCLHDFERAEREVIHKYAKARGIAAFK